MKNYHSKRSAHYRRLKTALKALGTTTAHYELDSLVELELPYDERNQRCLITDINAAEDIVEAVYAAATTPRYGGDGITNYFFVDQQSRFMGFASTLRHDDGSTTLAIFIDHVNREGGYDDE